MTDSFKYKANDGFADLNAATVTVTINGLNVAPVLSGIESSAVSYQAGGPGVIVTSDLQVADPDDANLSGATVAISSGFTAAEDSLSFTSPPGSGSPTYTRRRRACWRYRGRARRPTTRRRCGR